MKSIAAVETWIDERFHLAELSARVREKTVPIHRHSHWYLLGGITLFLFLIQIGTGILLLLYYRPTANEAFESVQYLTNRVHFGWLVRSVHAWSANLMILSAFAHMFSIALTRAFRKPREATWMSGMLLLLLVLGFGFSGYLLPWNTRAYFATKVGTEAAAQVPIVGHPMKLILRGGEDVTGATLNRFFALHVTILPLLAIGMLLLHLLLIEKFGTSVPASVEREWIAHPERRKEIKFFPNFLLRDLVGWYLVFGVLLTLAILFPSELGTKVDPFSSTPAGIKPEWYFLAQFQTLRLLPAKILHIDGEILGVLGFGLGGALFFVLPLLETLLGRRGVRIVRVGTVFALLYLIGMSVVGYLAK
jgi:cytochrome b6